MIIIKMTWQQGETKMYQYKTEPHLHVSEVSCCARIGAQEMIKLYAEAGYHTVFVTDHLTRKTFDQWGELPWEEKTKNFFAGYELAREAGVRYGINVLFAAELTFHKKPNDYLLYGITRDFLNQREDIFDLSIGEFYAYAKENGVTVIQAHPYRNGFTTPADVSCIDALEVYNSNPRHENHTEKAIAFAKEHGIPMTAGSDAHRYEDVAQSGVLTSYEIKSAEDYVRCVMSGDLKIIK